MKEAITKVCEELKTFLIEKNQAYGNSASEPVRIFSNVDAVEQINVRIDDKLSRIARGKEFSGDDTELDLIGYLILKRAIRMHKPEKQGCGDNCTCAPGSIADRRRQFEESGK